MEMTYDEMKACMDGYFETLAEVGSGGSEAKNKIEVFFAEDFICRHLDWPTFLTKQEWVDALCGGHFNNKYKWLIYKDNPSGYYIIDPSKKMAACMVREEVMHYETGKVIRACTNSVHILFKREDDNVKFYRELISRIPQKYQVDSLETGDVIPCWLFQEETR